VLLSWPPLRRHFYETFLRLHQALALLVVVSSWLHVQSTRLPMFALYTSLGIFGVASLADGWLLVRRSVALTRRKDNDGPSVVEIFKHQGNDDKIPIQLTLLLKEQLKMKAGQYINMWIPSLGFLSRMQSHPFIVTSWTGKRQSYLEFVIEPRGSWTRRLHSRALTVSGQKGGLHRVFFTGPHGISPPVDGYEYVFMVASGYGIVAHLPLLERLVQGTRAQEVRARRIRLVWEFADIGRSANWSIG
jgi:predicted ferric reductase